MLVAIWIAIANGLHIPPIVWVIFGLELSGRLLNMWLKVLREQYERAKRIEFIYNPLAWALYQTWRHVDEPPKEG